MPVPFAKFFAEMYPFCNRSKERMSSAGGI
jgi:hypothetical protein